MGFIDKSNARRSGSDSHEKKLGKDSKKSDAEYTPKIKVNFKKRLNLARNDSGTVYLDINKFKKTALYNSIEGKKWSSYGLLALSFIGIIVAGIMFYWIPDSFFTWMVAAVSLLYFVTHIMALVQKSKDFLQRPEFQFFLKYQNPEKIISTLETELNSNEYHFKSDSVTITDNFIVIDSGTNYNVLNLNDLVWAYVKKTEHYTYFVPTGATYQIAIITNDGRMYECSMGSQSSTELMQVLLDLAPYALVGYSDEIKDAWNSGAVQVINHVYFKKKEWFEKHSSSK